MLFDGGTAVALAAVAEENEFAPDVGAAWVGVVAGVGVVKEVAAEWGRDSAPLTLQGWGGWERRRRMHQFAT